MTTTNATASGSAANTTSMPSPERPPAVAAAQGDHRYHPRLFLLPHRQLLLLDRRGRAQDRPRQVQVQPYGQTMTTGSVGRVRSASCRAGGAPCDWLCLD